MFVSVSAVWANSLSDIIKGDRWLLSFMQCALCLQRCVCEHVRDIYAGVSCQFSDFHMSKLVFPVRVQRVGVLSISYCLNHDIITKGQRQTGRSGKLLYWRAGLTLRVCVCVWANTHNDWHQPFHVKSCKDLWMDVTWARTEIKKKSWTIE